jgi:hypothetical protein
VLTRIVRVLHCATRWFTEAELEALDAEGMQRDETIRDLEWHVDHDDDLKGRSSHGVSDSTKNDTKKKQFDGAAKNSFVAKRGWDSTTPIDDDVITVDL